MNSNVTGPLAEWIKEERKKLDPRIEKLIALAKWNLYYGPNMEGQDTEEVKWPGFEEACKEISKGLEAMHNGDVWVDTNAGEVLTTEPQPDSYEDANPDYDPEDEDSEEFITVTNPVNWEDYTLVEWRQTKHLMLGELAQYID